MLSTVETYLALRRATGFAMSNAEYLLKSFAAFAVERGHAYIHTQTAIDWAGHWCVDQHLCGIRSLIDRLFHCYRRCLATNGFRASTGKHSVKNGDADRSLCLLSEE